MAPKLRFSEGEKVLCFHGPLLYEAKCIKSQMKDRQIKYFIHYSGWNKNWDEWVPESRVLKYNDTNLQKQKELEKAHIKTKKNNKAGKLSGRKDEKNDKERAPTPYLDKPVKQKAVLPPLSPIENIGEKKKRTSRSEQNVEKEEEYVPNNEIRIKIPDELKIWLVDDFDLINEQKKLVRLPAQICVDRILEEFEKNKATEKGISINKLTAVEELCKGIREYFNAMLPKQLLYDKELPQYQEIAAKYPEKPMSQIYGFIHLLRLFERLGSVLAYTVLDSEAVTLFMNHFQEFEKFLSRPSQNYFSLSDYESISQEYLKKIS